MTFSEEIKQYAFSLGFDACGISKAEESGEEARYMKWVSENNHAGMKYLERNISKRLDPRLLVEGAKSIISVALNYYPPTGSCLIACRSLLTMPMGMIITLWSVKNCYSCLNL